MPVYDRSKLNTLLHEISNGTLMPAYLLFGEHTLCRQAADQVVAALQGTVHNIDGDNEDPNTTLAKLRSFSLLGGCQIYRVNGTRLFFSKNVAENIWKRVLKAWEDGNPDKAARHLRAMLAAAGLDVSDDPAQLSGEQWKKCFGFAKPTGSLTWTATLLADLPDNNTVTRASGDAGEQVLAALEAGIPKNNILLLLAEEVDKRKKLYKAFKEKYAVVDLSVESGSSSQAKKAQEAVLREQINQTLRSLGKSMSSEVVAQLLERVGFHPAAVVTETEKVALSVGDAQKITLEDLNQMVGRTREDAVFELTEAVGNKNLEQALLIASRLHENGIHGLAILATLRNFTRNLLLFRSLLEQPQYQYRPGLSPKIFQEQCLPLLKNNSRWQTELNGHPFALYMKFKTASTFSLVQLSSWLNLILAADRRLKGSPVAAETVLQHLLLSLFLETKNNGTLQNQN
jgi:DNA polymerase-3 subunit delta